MKNFTLEMNDDQPLEIIPFRDDHDEKMDKAALQSSEGRQANSRGKLLGLILRRAFGAESVLGFGDNMVKLGNVKFRIHSADGNHVSFNPKTDTAIMLFAHYQEKPQAGLPLFVRIYGMTAEDCKKVGKTTRYKTTERISLSLVRVKEKLHLANAIVPGELLDAKTIEDRDRLEKVIEGLGDEELTKIMDQQSRSNIHAFVRNSQR